MSKFKFGDWVKPSINNENGNSYCIKRIDEYDFIFLKDHPKNGSSNYDETKDWAFQVNVLEPAEPAPQNPKTYTLTPYIKPETVTINGVEYIMTENENVA